MKARNAKDGGRQVCWTPRTENPSKWPDSQQTTTAKGEHPHLKRSSLCLFSLTTPAWVNNRTLFPRKSVSVVLCVERQTQRREQGVDWKRRRGRLPSPTRVEGKHRGLVEGCGCNAPLLQLNTIFAYFNKTVGFLTRILDPLDSPFDFGWLEPDYLSRLLSLSPVYVLWSDWSPRPPLPEFGVCHFSLVWECGYPETVGSSGQTLGWVYLFLL